MEPKKILIGILVIAAVGIGYYAYTNKDMSKPVPQPDGQVVTSTATSTTDTTPVKKETVNIGVIVPLTGAQAAYGQGIKEGLDLSADGINNTPRFGIRINLIYEDTQSDVKNAVSAAHKLTSKDDVVALITGLSPVSLAIAPIAEETKTVLLTMAAGTGKLNTAGPYVFKNDDTSAGVGVALADEAYKRNLTSVGIVFAQYNDGVIEYHDAFLKEFGVKGGTVTGAEGFSADTTDFRTLLQKLLPSKPSAIAIMGLQRDCAIAMKQVRELGYKGQILGTVGCDNPLSITTAGAAAEGALIISNTGEPTAKFTELTQKKYGHDPLRWSAEAFDGLRFLALGLARAYDGKNPTTSYKLQNALSLITTFTGEAGEATFDKDGNAHRALHVKEVKNGEIVEVR
ncbi:MAG: ABC transporter substrate-binding protein [bacterium]|nr:ABC transporter substrate-binding protein [bacterium]